MIKNVNTFVSTKTISSIFIVPTLGINRDILKDNNFINGYKKNEITDHQFENCVYLLFKPENLLKFGEFCTNIVYKNNLFVDEFDLINGHVVLIFKMPKEYSEDFELIYKGQYSKTSEKFKDVFPKVLKIIVNGLHRDELSLQVRIFKKTTDLKKIWEDLTGENFNSEMEVWPIWDINKETLTESILIS